MFLAPALKLAAQDPQRDSAMVKPDEIDLEDLEDWDDLLSDLEAFLDSLMRPRSFVMINVSATPGYYNYKGTAVTRIQSVSTPTYSPFLAYYHKSGLGLAATGFMMKDRDKLNFYQFNLSPSYDYLSNLKMATGIAYTRYFSKDSLPFYVSPLTNELSAYFTWRKAWVRPTVMVNYAWGSREDMKLRLSFIERLALRRRIFNWLQENYEKDISDISLTASVVHDFYWLKVFSKKDNIRVTPQFAFTAGTQQFGFNQRFNNYTLNKTNRSDLLSTAREFSLDADKEFQALSASFILRTEYGIGKFYIQPQFLLDYYFPAKEKPLSTLFSVNAGLSF